LRRASGAATALVAVLASTLLFPERAAAHGLVGRADLPIPEWLFAWAASLVLIVSFVALATLWRAPRLEDDEGFRALPERLSRLLVNRVTDVAAGAIGVGLLGVVLWSGIFGEQEVQANFTPTFVYVIFWVGLVPASILLGDVFRAFNPWRAIGRAASFIASPRAEAVPEPLPYPNRLGRWPVVVTLLAFTWMELAYSGGSEPRNLAIAALVYTGLTLLGIAWFGAETWISRAEGFSVYFNLFSRISPVAVRDGRLGLRRPLAGLASLDPAPGTVALLIVMLGTVTFDGMSEGPTWAEIAPDIQQAFIDVGFGDDTALELSFTIGLLLGMAVIGAIYALGIAGVRLIDRRSGGVALARAFVHSLVPIAAVYAIAHYFSFLIYNGQSIAYLAADPLGKGWDLFGTADSGIDYGIISATGIWYVQVGALVAGHVAGLVLAHDRAISRYRGVKTATRSQYWMLGVMIAYTCFGLWLLAQSNA
jgi:hypothetical protein